MKPIYKHILILFSAALNIGFVLMAIYIALNHPDPSHRFSKMVEIVNDMNLSQDTEKEVLKTMHEFKNIMDEHHKTIKQAREKIMESLAADGALDKTQLRFLYDDLNRKERIKSKLFEEHLIKLRDLMGDEKGAEFYRHVHKKYNQKNGRGKK